LESCGREKKEVNKYPDKRHRQKEKEKYEWESKERPSAKPREDL